MRVLLIEEDPKVRALIRHHMSCEWPDAQIVAHAPQQRGPVPAEFLAQGHDAVLLSCNANEGHALMWLRELTSRKGFAPVIYLLEGDGDEEYQARATESGAFGVVSKARMDHEGFIKLLEAASRKHRRELADCVGLPADRLYYHLGQLEQAGLIPRPGARAVSTPAAS